MKKIIILLCLVMFVCVNAKHYKKNDKNPNATVLVKLNYLDIKGSRAKKSTTKILEVDGVNIDKGAWIDSKYQSIKLEPGFHEIKLYLYLNSFKETIVSGVKEASPIIKFEFEPNKTYYIDVYTEKDKRIFTKIREDGEPLPTPEI